jgi:hypothetical protein
LMRVEKREFAWEFSRQELYKSYESLHESSPDCLSTRVLWEFAWEFSRLSPDKSCVRVDWISLRTYSENSHQNLKLFKVGESRWESMMSVDMRLGDQMRELQLLSSFDRVLDCN